MNRRRFSGLLASSGFVMAAFKASALDTDVLQSPLMQLFRNLPDREANDGSDFPVTTAINHQIHRDVWPENPDMYWDPLGEDHKALFGSTLKHRLRAIRQEGIAIWTLEWVESDSATIIDALISNGWIETEAEWPLYQYAGSDAEREELAASLNLLGPEIRNGTWDRIAFPDETNVVLGSSHDLVHTVSDRIANYPPITTMDTHYHGLRYLLPVECYSVTLLPYQLLPVSGSTSCFVSKSWHGETPIMQSVGVRIDSIDDVEPFINEVDTRLASEISTMRDLPFSAFLQRTDVKRHYASVRLDFTVTEGEWDITDALTTGDLGFLPMAEN